MAGLLLRLALLIVGALAALPLEEDRELAPFTPREAFDSIWAHHAVALAPERVLCWLDFARKADGADWEAAGARPLRKVKSPFASIWVYETPACAGVDGIRGLYTDENPQSWELDEAIYHEALVHPAMVAFEHFHEVPARSVFVCGGGEMSIAREALRWPRVERVLTVDIDDLLVNVVREEIPSMNGDAFSDARSSVTFDDAVAQLRASSNASYSVIVNDLPDAQEGQAAASFYSREFFQLAKSKLVEGGMLVASTGPCNLQANSRKLLSRLRYDFGDDLRGKDPALMDYVLVYSLLAGVFRYVDVLDIPMLSWHYGQSEIRKGAMNWMYCVYVASDSGMAGSIPARAVDALLPVVGAPRQAGAQSGLQYYNGTVHTWSFSKSSAVKRLLRAAVTKDADAEDILRSEIRSNTWDGRSRSEL